MRKKTAAVAGLALVLAASPAVWAEEPSVGQKVNEAMQRALNLMERFIGVIPGYEAPEVTREGDIIIRRKRPDTVPDAADNKPLPEGQRRVKGYSLKLAAGFRALGDAERHETNSKQSHQRKHVETTKYVQQLVSRTQSTRLMARMGVGG